MPCPCERGRLRHPTLQVYTAEHASNVLAVKLFRFSNSMDHGHTPAGQGPGGPGVGGGGAALAGSMLGGGGSGGSSSFVSRETELEAVLSLQYRLCNISHPHVLQHVAVYPHVYEVCLSVFVFARSMHHQQQSAGACAVMFRYGIIV